ncbi:MAG: NAD(P)/FAD-dependent oxidoreductase [Gemmatimonadetes bacterium]|nr:NAD(P)/FAD-dependent oxidoreductase [Gemmatimonadota bacterium]
MTDLRPKILILGAGFGGLWAARALRRYDADVTLLDRNNFHTFLPLLYQVGAAELEPFAIARPVRTIVRGQRNLHFLHATARRVDLDRKLVHTSHGVHAYDYLVIALGTAPWDFGVPGVRRHAFPLKTLEDGIALRSHVLSRFELALHEPDAERRARLLRFVVVGGGPTGVEYAGALSELIRGPLARDYRALAGQSSILLLEAADRLLTAMSLELGDYARRRLERMGVEVRLGARVTGVADDGVHLADATIREKGPVSERSEWIPTTTVAWTAGVQGVPEVRGWGLPLGRAGRIRVRETLQVEDRPEVFVVGDLAEGPSDGPDWPMLAQVGMQGGAHAARTIQAVHEGRPAEPFHYRDKGLLAVIGRNAAAAHVGGRDFTGLPAWWLWLLIHIVYLIGFRNRFAVLLNWAWGYLFFERVARILLPFRRDAPAWPESVDPSETTDTGRNAES